MSQGPDLRRAIASLGLLIAIAQAPALAGTPASGTLSPATPTLSYAYGPNAVSNPSSTCMPTPATPCDDFALTVDLPADYASTHPNDVIRIETSWPLVAEDYDITLLDAQGAEVDSAANSVTDPEVIETRAGAGRTTYTIRVIPFIVAGSTATTTISLVSPLAPPPPPPTAPGLAPRYHVHVSPPALGNSSGEPTVGYNPLSKRAMFISFTQALRVTFQENITPQLLPASCDATWEDKSGTLTTLNSLDPIIYTDQVTGRTFNSQLSGANSLFEFSDDDGETWRPGQFGPPNGGVDHQGIITGPYPAGKRPPTATYPNAFYYCSQSVVSAFCARSDDGGQTVGPGFPVKNPDCVAGSLQGHPKVAPDGTLYVPDSTQCLASISGDDKVVAFVSEDAGMTFTPRPIPQSTGGAGSDPSIGIATDGTVYMCYENADSHAHVAVSHDKGLTWVNDTDIGRAAGLVQTRFQAMSAGDPDRGACAFLGTSTSGDGNSLDFQGLWYPYIATTYDSGATWHLVNVSPDDPVQGYGGIGPSGTNRNLLDFNDLEIDEFGRVLFAYADGCTGGCVRDPSANGFTDKGTIARQSGGRTLFKKFDNRTASQFNSVTPLAPAAACANDQASLRTVTRTRFVWNAPDDGGAPVTNYKVYRASSASGPFNLLGNAGPKTEFVDGSGDSTVPRYFYKVVAENRVGSAPESNVIGLAITTPPVIDTCSLPGQVIAQDAVGDGTTNDTDLVFLAVAEPEAYAGNLVLTVKVAGFTGGQPAPTSFYPVLFPSRGNRYVALDASRGTARFTYGTYVDVASGVLSFTEVGTLDPRSTFAADGTMTLVVPKALLGNPATGSVIAGFDARARIGAQSASSRDTAGPADYMVRGTAICAANTAPVAALQATPVSGDSPLTVNFDASASSDADGSVTSYSLDYGDGSGGVTQSGPLFSHSYRNSGPGIAEYPARLTVTDDRDLVSSNVAERVIEVQPPAQQSVTPFTFVERNGVATGTFITSEAVRMAGYTGTLPVSIGNGQYRINSGSFTTAAGQIAVGDTLTVRHVSASAPGATTESLVTVGDYSTTFRSVTSSADSTPNAFGFGTRTGQAPGALVESDPVTLSGFNTGIPIVAGPGLAYRIDGGAYTTTQGTLQPGQSLQVRHTASNTAGGYTKTYLKAGGVVGYFTTRTR